MKTFFTLFALLFATFIYAQVVPNGGFEFWVDDEPVDWTTNNVGGNNLVSQTGPGNSGMWAVSLQTNATGDPIAPELVSGYDNLGFPVSEKYLELRFYYKFNQGGSDKTLVEIVIYDDEYSPLGSGMLVIQDTEEDYIQAEVPITYTEEGTAAHAIIQFKLVDNSGSGPPSIPSWFVVDDVTFAGGILGIDEQAQTEINIYPNPVTDVINIEAELEIEQLSIFNTLGQEVYHDQLKRKATQIDLRNYQRGVYFVRIKAKDKTTTKKIMVK